MEIGSLQCYGAAAAITLSEESLRSGLEIGTMKKMLDSQKMTARALIQSIDSASLTLRDSIPRNKGRVIDIRV